MFNDSVLSHDVVLVGGGHSHVEVIRQFAMRPAKGVRLTLISRDAYTPYSGMLPGLLAGHYSFAEAHIDLSRLCTMAQVRFIHADVVGIDLVNRRLDVAGRPQVAFDIVCFDTGSTPRTKGIGGVDRAIAVKPVDQFQRRWRDLESALNPRQTLAIDVIGAGAGGVELALSLQYRLRTKGGDAAPKFRVCTAGDDILLSHPRAVRQYFSEVLRRRGIDVVTNARVVAIEADALIIADGRRLASDASILVTGAAALDWYARSPLETDAAGFISVNDSLQSVSHDFVFATGDCANFVSRPLPKAGVYAVRQGPVLADNLRAIVTGEAPSAYKPQSQILALICTGDRFAVASRGPFFLKGQWVWRWKDWIDRRWMTRYQTFEMPQQKTQETDANGADAMRCGGCGAKVPAATLRDVLVRVRTADDSGARSDLNGVSVGLQAPDDAAVIVVPNGQHLVQSVDHFRAFIDDPYRFALITTNHCLNDLFAMGARPTSGLATAIVPYAEAHIVGTELESLLRGATDGLRAAGASLAGGHSAEGIELSFGLTVNGFVDPASLIKKSGWRVGDRLILTKPLGTGVILAANMRGRAEVEILEAAIATMMQSNQAALRVLLQHQISACTDVTGFGFFGHVKEMAQATSALGAEIDVGRITLIDGATDLLASGFASTLAPSNRAELSAEMGLRQDRGAGLDILFDPQTAGGLLASIPEAEVVSCLDALRGAGYEAACVVGHVSDEFDGIRLSF